MKPRKLYLDGLKGIACLLIMFGHFSGIFKYATDAAAIDCVFLRAYTVFPISFLTAESFWLYLFFAISGYLVASSNVREVRDLIRKVVSRAIRFIIPVVGTILIVFFIGETIRFHNQELRPLIDNPWYFRSYENTFTINDLFLEPIRVFTLGNSAFDSPLWVMRDMLLSSFLIYGISCIIKCNKAVIIRGGGGTY